MEVTLNAYLNFLAKQYSIRIPHVRNGNQGVDALLHGSDPLWNLLKGESAVLDARRLLSNNAEFKTLYKEYSAERPQISFDNYVDTTLLDFALKLLRRAPALDAKTQVGALVTDFMNFLQARRIEAIEVAPLFNLRVDSPSIQLDAVTQIRHLNLETRVRIYQHFTEPSIVFSRTMLDRVELGIFRGFSIPIRSTTIAPPDDDIAMDAELMFRMLKPGKIINYGFLAYWTIGWHLNEHGGSRLSSQFPWSGPSFDVVAEEVRLLPKLWREIRNNMTISDLRRKRFFHTARRRFVKATENQAPDDRLLDLFIALEALLLRSTEKHHFTEKVARRLSVLIHPLDAQQRNRLESECSQAYKQRHTVAHGIDRDLVGFDETASTFNDLVLAVDLWVGRAIISMMRLIGQRGHRDAAITLLDQAATDHEQAKRVASIVDTT